MLTLALPFRTWAHDVPAAPKLAALAAATAALFPIDDLAALSAAAAASAALHVSLGPDRRLGAAREALRMLRPFVWVLVLVMGWHLATGQTAEGARVCLRLLTAVSLANLVTMTTRLDDLTSVAERLAAPLRPLGVQPRALALAAALAVRFTPVLTLRGAQLSEAWRARARRRPGWRLAAPLCLSALDDAERVAEALRARGGAAPPGRSSSPSPFPQEGGSATSPHRRP
ncbi:CbiQ family ECF transporter T component [Oceanicella actignis]|uniref:Biotin transport system permease protein n=1 Tax=Oceanicella actignis TaxID=1189325 RepID=A0A1M7SUA9_9RHOB|nr:CbiQ family ECF transporter T component [Oceanicella actignis]SES71172.1 biotin transport system permease protein [Oceanicella actignis]SHN62069.1 biotin transport system permease protein [Oceanicella actignis]